MTTRDGPPPPCRLDEGVALVTRDHPPVIARSQAVRQHLADARERALADPAAQAIVVRPQPPPTEPTRRRHD